MEDIDSRSAHYIQRVNGTKKTEERRTERKFVRNKKEIRKRSMLKR